MTIEPISEEQLIAAIRERYQRILGQIADLTRSTGRPENSVHLVVVTKAQPLNVVRAVIAAGVTVLGENYVEEAVEKIATFQKTGVEWHMIGHVQSRKAELTAKHFSMLHSLDNTRLAGRLDRFCAEYQKRLPVLLEVNVSEEESKFGFPAWDENKWESLIPDVEQILSLSHLEVMGLMTMPPYFPDPEESRPFFKTMRRLQDFLAGRFPGRNWKELSMGTSVDYSTAVQEGATYVRIGEAIVGPRQKL